MQNRRGYTPVTQLCLFSEAEMTAMAENREPLKIREDQQYGDWVLWELGLLHCLSGKAYRDQRAFLTGRVRPVKPQPKPLVPDGLIAYHALLDCLADDRRLNGGKPSAFFPYA